MSLYSSSSEHWDRQAETAALVPVEKRQIIEWIPDSSNVDVGPNILLRLKNYLPCLFVVFTYFPSWIQNGGYFHFHFHCSHSQIGCVIVNGELMDSFCIICSSQMLCIFFLFLS